MALERTEDVERGVGLIPALGEVMPEEADEGVRPVYEGVRAKLRVPFVNFVFRVLANYPDYLRFAWGKTEPHLLTTGFERAADELRARALIERVPDPPEEGWQGMGDIESMRAFTDTIHYVLPRLLMVVSAFDEGLGDESGGGEATPEPAIAPGVAEGAVSLPMVAPEEVTGDLSKLFEEIRQRHGHPGVASYYRAVGRWPRFLEAVWERVGPLVGSGPYERRKGELLQYARSAVLELPLPGREEATALGVDDESVGELRAILAVFRFRVIPDTFLEVAIIKAMLDGPEAARSSRFSFAAT